MKKIFILFLIAVSACALSVYAEPQTVVLTPADWQDVFNTINVDYILVSGYAPTLTSSLSLTLNYIQFVFANGTVTVTPAGSASSFTLQRGIYLVTAWLDSSNNKFYYVYTISGLVAQGQFPTATTTLNFDKKIYVVTWITESSTTLFNTVMCILYDWQGGNGGKSAWILFNVTGNMPVYYSIKEGIATYYLSYGGGPPIYMLYVGKTLPLNVTTAGFSQLFGAGAYLIVGSNWFKINYSETAPSQPTQNQTGTNTATLTVTVTPSSYKIQFLSAGALVKEANATLSYAFPKNSTVTVRIVDSAGTEKYKFDVKMDSDKYYSFNFGTDNSIYNPTQTYTLTLYFFEMSPTGAYRGSIVVDSVQVIGVNASITRSAQGVSNVKFTNLPAGHYQIIVQKEGYYETRVWVNLDSDKALYVGLFKKADTGGSDRPYQGGYVAPSNTTEPFSAIGWRTERDTACAERAQYFLWFSLYPN